MVNRFRTKSPKWGKYGLIRRGDEMSRNVNDLHPDLQKKVSQLISECNKAGLKIGISECLRTVQEQDALYAQGRTKPGKIVTNAKGANYSSMHQWGVAFDFYRNDGKGAYVDYDNFFTKVGKIGKKIGLEWGGDWKSIKDKPHFQLPNWGSTTKILRNTYKTPEIFMKTWKKEVYSSPNVSTMIVLKQNVKIVQEYVGTTADGVWGKNSKSCMIKKLQSLSGQKITGKYSEDLVKNLPVLKFGNTSEIVKCMQGLLFVHGLNPQRFNGIFNDTTENAVVDFEKQKKLTVDRGIVGKQVWTALLS